MMEKKRERGFWGRKIFTFAHPYSLKCLRAAVLYVE
jgi:hypothetical protein